MLRRIDRSRLRFEWRRRSASGGKLSGAVTAFDRIRIDCWARLGARHDDKEEAD